MAYFKRPFQKPYLVNAYVENIAETTTEAELHSFIYQNLKNEIPGLGLDVKRFMLDTETNTKFTNIVLKVHDKKLGRLAIEKFSAKHLQLVDSQGNSSDDIRIDYACLKLITLSRTSENPTFDVCFVHGLGGHALKTFSSKGKDPSSLFLWPRDLLPKLLDTSKHRGQYMTFGYDAPVMTSDLMPGEIEDIAEGLLSKLKQNRGEDCQRPIYFICHSLGGLVVCQAVLLAVRGSINDEPRTKYYAPFHVAGSCTIRGVVFFGTPFKGDKMAWLGSVVIKILFLRWLFNATTLNYLSIKNRDVKKFVVDFASWTEKFDIPILTFYERKKLKKGPLRKLIVEKDSAKGFFNENIVSNFPIKADHSSMVKFDGPHDPIYTEDVADPIKALIHGSLSRLEASYSIHIESHLPRNVVRPPEKPETASPRKVELSRGENIGLQDSQFSVPPTFSNLASGDLSDRSDSIFRQILQNHKDHKPPLDNSFPGTCNWIENHPRYRKLLQTSANDVLFIEASGGWGKSVLARFIVSTMQQTHLSNSSEDASLQKPSTIICYSLTKKKLVERTPLSILEDILGILVGIEPNIVRDTLFSMMKSKTREFNVTLYWALLQKVRRQLKQNIVCVVDGLDECIDNVNAQRRTTTNQEILRFLKTVCSLVIEPESRSHGHLKVVFTTRSKQEIMHATQSDNFPIHGSDMRMTIRDSDTAPGFLKFVRRRVELLSQHRDLPEAHQELMIEKISERCSPIFQMAHQLLEQIRLGDVNFNDKNDIDRYISNFKSSSLDAAYQDQLDHIQMKYRQKAANVLRLLYFAQNEMSVEDIQHAFAVNMDSQSVDENSLEEFRRAVGAGNTDFLKSGACGSLIRLEYEDESPTAAENPTVALDHPTVRGFLAGISDDSRLRIFSCKSHEKGHLYLALLCVKYLMLWSSLQDRLEETQEADSDRHEKTISPFAAYAAYFWICHAEQAGSLVSGHLGLFAAFLDTRTYPALHFNRMCLLRHIMEYQDFEESPDPILYAPDDFLAIHNLHHLLRIFYQPTLAKNNQIFKCLRKPRRGQKMTWDSRINMMNQTAHRTILHYACENGGYETVRYLLECGARQSRDCDGETPFSLAVDGGYEEIALKLLSHDEAAERATNSKGINSLHIACSKEMKSLVVLFLLNKYNPNEKAIDDWTPVHIAAENGNAEILWCLLASGGSPEAVKAGGSTPLHLAAKSGHLRAIKVLFNVKPNLNPSPLNENHQSPLYIAARGGHLETFKFLVKKYPNVKPDKDGWFPIHAAARGGHLAIVKLLEDSATLKTKTSLGKDALHLSAAGGHIKVVQYLVNHLEWDQDSMCDDLATDRDKTPEKSINALYLAIANGHEEVAEFLLGRSVRRDVKDVKGRTLIHQAAGSGCKNIMMKLISEGHSLFAKDAFDATPLHYASSAGHLEICRMILQDFANESNFSINQVDNDNRTAFLLACEAGHSRVAELLLEYHADPQICNSWKTNPLTFAARHEDPTILELLLKIGVDPNQGNKFGTTALHQAAVYGRVKCVDILLKVPSINVDTRDRDGITPLIDAASHFKKRAIKALLEKGADPIGLRDDMGMNAMDYLRDWPPAASFLAAFSSRDVILDKTERDRILRQKISNLLHYFPETEEYPKRLLISDLGLCYQRLGDYAAAKVCKEQSIRKLWTGEPQHSGYNCDLCFKSDVIGPLRVCCICSDSGICYDCYESSSQERPLGCSIEHEQIVVGDEVWESLQPGEVLPGQTLNEWIAIQRALYPWNSQVEGNNTIEETIPISHSSPISLPERYLRFDSLFPRKSVISTEDRPKRTLTMLTERDLRSQLADETTPSIIIPVMQGRLNTWPMERGKGDSGGIAPLGVSEIQRVNQFTASVAQTRHLDDTNAIAIANNILNLSSADDTTHTNEDIYADD